MVARTDRLQLVLEANADKLTAGVNKAAKSLEGLDKATAKGLAGVETRFAKMERAIAASLANVENRIGRVGGRISTFGDGSKAALESFALTTISALDRAMKKLEQFATESITTRRQLEKLQDVRLDRLGAGLTKAASQATTLGTAAQKGATGGLSAFSGFEKGVDSLIGKVGRAAVSVQGLFLAAGTGAGAGAPVKFAADFERALAGVDTLLEDGGVAIGKYREQLLALSGGSSKSLFDLTKGLNDIISAGIPAVEGASGAFDVLAASQKAATTAGAETEEVARGVATVLNIYKDAGLSATDVTDKFFAAAARGAVTIPDLSASIGQVAGVAKSFGIGLDEVLGFLTALTNSGLSTAEAVTSLRQILISIARPPKIAADAIATLNKEVKDANISFGVTALQQQGLVKILDNLSTATGGSAEAFSQLFTDVDGLKGVLALSARGFGEVQKEIEAVKNSAGATDVAYKKVAGTFNETFGVLKNRVLAVLIEAGQRVLPQVQAAFTKFGDFVVKNQTKIAETFERFIEGLFSIGAFLAEKGPGILKFLVTFFAVKKITEATQALSGFITKIKDAVAASRSGEDSGASFATGFQKKVKGIGPALKELLKSAPVIGAFVAAGIAFGEAIIEGISDILFSELEVVITEAANKAKDEADRIAKNAGFKDTEDVLQAEEQFKAGRLFSFGGSLLSLEQVAEAAGEEEAQRVALERIRQLEDESNKAKTAARDARNEAGVLDAAISKAGGKLADRATVAALVRQRDQINALANEYDTVAAAAFEAAKVADDGFLAIGEGAEFAAAESEQLAKAEKDRAAAEKEAAAALADKAAKEKAKEKAAANAKRSAEELRRILAEGEEAARAARAQQIATSQEAIEALIQAQRAATEATIAEAEERGASEAAVIQIRIDGAEAVRKLVEDQVALINAAAVEEIVAATEVANKQIEEASRSAAAQKAIQEKLAQDVLAVEAKAARESAKVRQDADKAVADAERQRRLEAARRNPQTGGSGTSGTALTGLERAQQIAGIARDPLGALAGIPGPLGTAAQAVQLVGEVPAILNGISDFLDGGAEDLAVAFFDSLVRFGEVLLRRIPELVGRLFNDLIPFLVQGFFDKAPEFISAFITDFLPALFSGLGRLFDRLIDALTGGAKSLFGAGDKDSVAGLIGRTTGLSLLGKVATGDFGSISAEDIPLIGGFFHKGGVTHESGRNPLAAAAMSGSVPAFATGGIVEGVSQRIRNAFGGVFTDDVPALLQAGEGVLRRQAVDRLGGPNAVDAINRGGNVGGATEVRIEARDGAVRDLLAMIVSKITVEAKTPGTGLQSALQKNPRALGTNDVRARRLG